MDGAGSRRGRPRSEGKMTKGKIHGPGGAAELLGINPNTLRGRLNKLGIIYGRKK